MIINKNKLKLIPIFNKSLKEIYANKEYDMIHLYSLLKENDQSYISKKFIVKSEVDGIVDVYSGLFFNKEIKDIKYLYTFDNSLDKSLDSLTKEIFDYNAKTFNYKIKQDIFIRNLNHIVLVFVDECIKNGIFKNMFTIKDLLRYIQQHKQTYLNNLYNIVINIYKILKLKNNIFGKFEIVDSFEDQNDIEKVETNIFGDKLITINYQTKVKTNTHDQQDEYEDDYEHEQNDNSEDKNTKKIKTTFYLKKDIDNLFNYIIENVLSSEKIVNKKLFEYSDNDIYESYHKQIQIIAKEYTSNYDELLVYILNNNINIEDIRKIPDGIEDVIRTLNDRSNSLYFTTDVNKYIGTSKGNVSSTKGKGELAVHLMFQTTNVCTPKEPDAIIYTKSGDLLRCSIKCMSYNLQALCGKKDDAADFMQSLHEPGKELNVKNLKNVLYNIIYQNFKTESHDNICKMFKIEINELKKFKPKSTEYDSSEIIRKYREFKQKILKQGSVADYVLIVDPYDQNRFSYINNDNLDQLCDLISIVYFNKKNNSFNITRNVANQCFTKNYENIVKNIVNNVNNVNYSNSVIEIIISYILFFLNKNESNYLEGISSTEIVNLTSEIKKNKSVLNLLLETSEKEIHDIPAIPSYSIKLAMKTAIKTILYVISGSDDSTSTNKNYYDRFIKTGQYEDFNKITDIRLLNQIKEKIEEFLEYTKYVFSITKRDNYLLLNTKDCTRIRNKIAGMHKHIKDLTKKENNAQQDEVQEENEGYKRKGMTLKEVFKNLY